MGWIYKITNQVNGKMYIGKTESINPYDRWKRHLEDYKRERDKHRPFYNAIEKYGVENFLFEVIDKSNDSDKLCELEKYYINKFRTYIRFEDCNGYNATLGGDGKQYLNLNEEEVIRVHIENGYISGTTAKYYDCDKKVIQKILNKHGIRWLNNDEVTEYKFLQEYGGLVQLDFNCRKVINIFKTPKDAYTSNSEFKEKSITLAYRPYHKTHHAYGYTWYRLNELPEKYKPLLDEYYNKTKSDIDN